MKWKQKSMSSRKRALTATRYSFPIFTSSASFLFFSDFLTRPCLFSSFVASDTNDVD